MPTKKQKRIKKRLDKRQSKVNESRATFGTNDPDLGKFDRRLNRLKRTVNQAEKQGMDVNYDTTNASGEGAVKTTKVKSSINMNYSPNKMGHSPAEMGHSPMENQNKGYAKQERKDLLNINPIANHASGSWMSKHSKSAFQMGHSPMEMGRNGEDKNPKNKKKNTSGVFGGDTIMGDENNDGNMLSRGLDYIKKNFPLEGRTTGLTRPYRDFSDGIDTSGEKSNFKMESGRFNKFGKMD